MRAMCDSLSIRAIAFMEIESGALFSTHVQIKCFPFSGVRVLMEATLASEESKRLLSMVIELPGGNMAATKLLSGKKDMENVSVMAATSGGRKDFAFVRRASCSVCVL